MEAAVPDVYSKAQSVMHWLMAPAILGCESDPPYSHYQSTNDVVYVCVVPWSEFPIVPS